MSWKEPAERVAESSCGCPLPPGCWGRGGYHFQPNPQWPDSVAQAIAYERCPAYRAAVERKRQAR